MICNHCRGMGSILVNIRNKKFFKCTMCDGTGIWSCVGCFPLTHGPKTITMHTPKRKITKELKEIFRKMDEFL